MPSSVYPRKGARGTSYEARWGLNPETGNPFTKRFSTRKAAKDHLATVGNQTYIPVSQSITVDAALEQWLQACEFGTKEDGRPKVEPHTLRHYKTEAGHLRALTLDGPDGRSILVRDIKLAKLDRPLVIQIRTALVAALTRDAAKRAFNRFKSAMIQANNNGQLPVNPAATVPPVLMDKRDKKRVTIPQPEEVQTILGWIERLSMANDGRTRIAWRRYRPMVKLLVFAGLRPSEMRGLPRRDVLVERSVIRVSQRADETGIIGSPKSAAGYREIVVPRSFMAELEAHLSTIADDPDALVFANGEGNAESLANITNRAWYPLMASAGFKGKKRYNLYTLRHFYASWLIREGANIKTVQRAMGHESSQVTLDHYGHLFNDEASQEVARAEKMETFLRDDPSSAVKNGGESRDAPDIISINSRR